MFCVDGHAGVVFMIVLVFGHLMAIAVIDFYVFCAQIDTRVNVCVCVADYINIVCRCQVTLKNHLLIAGADTAFETTFECAVC